jgi:lysophospholipase L1-like esterase
LDAWAAANHVDYLDLTGVLAQVPQQQIYYDGEHLRAAGHRLVATEIERFLLSGERR